MLILLVSILLKELEDGTLKSILVNYKDYSDKIEKV